MHSLIRKYDGLSIQVKAAIWFLIAGFLQKGVSVITVPIFTRIMTTQEYGRFGVFCSWYEIVSILVTLNLSAGIYTQGIIKHKDCETDFSASFQGLNTVLFTFWILLFWAFRGWFSDLMDVPISNILIMIILSWLNSGFALWAAHQRVNYIYRLVVVLTTLNAILSPLIGIILVLNMNDRVLGRILGIVISASLIYIIPMVKEMFSGGTIVSQKFWKYALSFNIPLIPHYLAQIVLNSTDRIMIKGITGESDAGKYTLVYSVALIMLIFNTALLNTIHPWLYSKIKDNKIEDIAKVVYYTYGCIGIVNVILIAFAPEIVMIFAPSDFYDAIWALPPISMSIPFLFIYGLFADFEFYYDKAYLASFASVLSAILNILLNYIFIPQFGYIAAGYTTLFCYIFFAVFHYIAMKYICNTKLGGKNPYQLRILLPITISFILIGFAFLLTYSNTIVRYLTIILCLTVLFIFKNRIKNYIQLIISLKGQGSKS